MTGTSDGRRRKRLSADLPQNWLHDPQYWNLSDRAWRLHTHALMWAIGRTDGAIPASMLSTLLAGADADRAMTVKELEAHSLWLETPGGWQVTRWDETQSTVEQIERGRERERDKKRRQRTAVPQGTTPRDSPRGTRHGTSRDGTSREGTDNRRVTNPGDAPYGTCRECGYPLNKPRDNSEQWCRRCQQWQQLDPWAAGEGFADEPPY